MGDGRLRSKDLDLDFFLRRAGIGGDFLIIFFSLGVHRGVFLGIMDDRG